MRIGTPGPVGCGPNYCCCTTNPFDDNDFDAHNVLGQTLVNAVCTAAQLSAGGTGQTAAVRRQCGGKLNCEQICKGIKKQCIESIHMYGNDAADDVHKKGMFTHLYGSCTSGGCGPNYCCCTDKAAGALTFKRNSAVGQAMVSAICTSAQYGGTGETTAVRKDCSSKEKKTCKEVCAGLKLQCLESIHLYGDDGADGVHKKGVTMKYKYIGKPIRLCENKVTPRPVLQYPFATFQRVHVCFPNIGIRTHIYDSCDNAGECTASWAHA